MTDMILNDILHDTASELQSLEDDGDIHAEAVTMHHNPTLENIYQRLEQMEVYVYSFLIFYTYGMCKKLNLCKPYETSAFILKNCLVT